VVYAAVGFVVARRQPGNPIGWILITFIVVFLLSGVAGGYAALYYRFGHHGLPLAPVAELLTPLWAPALLLFPVVILLSRTAGWRRGAGGGYCGPMRWPERWRRRLSLHRRSPPWPVMTSASTPPAT
jgi:hypothetical protein